MHLFIGVNAYSIDSVDFVLQLVQFASDKFATII